MIITLSIKLNPKQISCKKKNEIDLHDLKMKIIEKSYRFSSYHASYKYEP